MYRNAVVALMLSVIVGVGSAFAGGSTTFTGTGDFSDAGLWSPGLPTSGTDIVIDGVCNIDSDMNDTLIYGNLSFSSPSAVLRWTDSSKSLKVNALTAATSGSQLDMSGGGTLEVRGSGNPFSTANLDFIAGTGTIEYFTQFPQAQTITSTGYFNLKISGARQNNNVTIAIGTITIAGDFQVLSTFDPGFGVVALPGNIFTYGGSSQQQITPMPYGSLSVGGAGEKVFSNGTYVIQNSFNLGGAKVTISTNANIQTGELSGDATSSIFIDATSDLDIACINECGYDGILTGSGSISKFGANNFNMNGNGSSFTGNVDVFDGALVLFTGNAIGTSSVTVHPAATLASGSGGNPLTASISLLNATLTGFNGGGIISGSVTITSNSNISLRDIFNPSFPVFIELSGSVLSTGNTVVSGPPPMPDEPTPVLFISGALSGGTMIVGPSAEVYVDPTGTLSLTTINVGTGGSLIAENTSANQSVSVTLAMGAVLGGTGEFSDTCSVSSTGGIIQPGPDGPMTGVGILPLTTGAGSPSTLSLDATSVLEFDLGTPASSDRITVSGQLTLGGSLVLKPAAGFGPGTYTLLTHGGGLLGTGLNLPPPLPGLSYALDTTTVSTEVRLVVGALPITITSPATFSGAVNEDFAYPITVTAPPAPPVTITTTALPIGLRLEGSSILGIPTVPGSYTFTITATNGITTATLLVTLTIADVDSTSVGSFSAEGKVGLPFFLDLAEFSDNPTGVSFTTTALPEGLRLAGTTIIGTPKTAGETIVTVTGTKPNAANGTGTVTITILAKAEILGTQLSDLIVDPEEPGVNEVVLFFVTAFNPEGLVSTITWDFGDGTTGAGEQVEKTYTSAATYNVTVTAVAGGKTTTLSKSVTVTNVDPNAPKITTATASPTPSVTGQLVTFTATGTDANNDALTYEWNLGTGAASVTGNPVTFTYTQVGEYPVTVKVTDATGKSSRTTEFLHLVGDGAGEINLDNGDEEVSFDGIKQKITFSEDGVIGLSLDIASLTRELLDVSTDFGITGRRSVAGETPSAKFESAGLRVAKSTVREKETRKERGKARKTLAISNREVGAEAKVETEPTDKSVSKLKLKGDFFPSRSSSGAEGSLSRATKDEVAKSDKVTASGSITMPGGLDMTDGTEVEVALGNIIDKVVIDSKGKGKGRFTTLQLRVKTDKTTKKTIADSVAKFSIKMSVADMVADGFDTEGVVVSKDQNGKPLSIQTALMIGGVVYTADNPVTLKVSPKEDKAQMVTRSSGN